MYILWGCNVWEKVFVYLNRKLVLLIVYVYKIKYNIIFLNKGFFWFGKMIIIYVILFLNNYIYWRFLYSCK